MSIFDTFSWICRPFLPPSLINFWPWYRTMHHTHSIDLLTHILIIICMSSIANLLPWCFEEMCVNRLPCTHSVISRLITISSTSETDTRETRATQCFQLCAFWFRPKAQKGSASWECRSEIQQTSAFRDWNQTALNRLQIRKK